MISERWKSDKIDEQFKENVALLNLYLGKCYESFAGDYLPYYTKACTWALSNPHKEIGQKILNEIPKEISGNYEPLENKIYNYITELRNINGEWDSSSYSWEVLVHYGDKLLEKGDVYHAVDNYMEGARVCNSGALLKLALAVVDIGNNKEYTKELLRIGREKFSNNIFNFKLGDICYEEYDFEKAMEYYSRCTGNSIALFACGKMNEFGYGTEWDLDQATLIYQAIIDKEGPLMVSFLGCRERLENVAKKYSELAWDMTLKGRFSQAKEAIDKAIAILPNETEFICVKGAINALQEDYRSALECWYKIIEIDSKFAFGFKSKGPILYEKLKEQGLVLE